MAFSFPTTFGRYLPTICGSLLPTRTAEHESEIILHKAAKKYLDEAGLKHFPSVKQLDAEYAELLSKKKEIYVAYRKAREESRELLTVKANVDRVLGIEKDDAPEKEAPSETRS